MEVDSRKTTGGWKARRRRKQRRARAILGLCLSAMVALTLFTRWMIVRRNMRADLMSLLHAPGSPYPDPPGIVLHASETPAVVNGVPINAARLEEIHAHDHPNWATVFEGKTYHIGYHYVILPDGTIEQGRPDHCLGCHAPHYNDWIGICVIGQFDPSGPKSWWPSRPTAAQIASIVRLCERLMSQYHIPPQNVLRHRDTKETWCPGRRFPYREIVQRLQGYAAAHPETVPIRPPVGSIVPVAANSRGLRQ